tara:strand:+ start:34 stop:291 length:258 start_codon:yes stop_codon:yes gene_type:complete
MKHHPIQLKAIQVKKLYLEVFDKAIASAEELEVDVQFKVGSKVPEPNDDVILVNFICNVKKMKALVWKSIFLVCLHLKVNFQGIS